MHYTQHNRNRNILGLFIWRNITNSSNFIAKQLTFYVVFNVNDAYRIEDKQEEADREQNGENEKNRNGKRE